MGRTSTVDKKAEDDELPVRLCNYTDVYYQDRIRANSGEYMQATASRLEVDRFHLRVGETLITKDSEDWEDIGVPALVEETAGDFVCGYHIGIICPGPKLHADFLFRAMQTTSVNRQLQVSSSGVTRFGLPNAAVREALLPHPSPHEQRTIAAFLDCETDRLDKLVEKNRLLIERLTEYRTALITRAVTCGLDPSARLKPSGVEWLGDVPEHWSVKRLRYLASVNNDSLSNEEDPLREISYVDIGSVDSVGRIVETEDMPLEEAPTRARRLVRDGDTIVSTVRTYLRAIAPIRNPSEELVVSTGFAVIRPSGLLSGFCSWALRERGFVEEVVARSTGVSYPAINPSSIRDFPFLIPPEDEQYAIADYLDRETEQIDVLTSKAGAAIERLQEYRAALITAAVTGKIDVREPE